ncbi:MAG: TraR/DksA C4-type zinc finger protein [Nitrospirae bacterium]|nr:TraR/DksA C4-type zinc finger protein [Nitrospirota bacterium]
MKKLDEVVRFHGHVCPGLVLGYRVSLFALKELGRKARDEEIIAVVENNSCAVDAVQVMTGCTFGKGNLIFKDYGKQVYTFIRRPSGKAIRISIDWTPPPETEKGKEMWQRYVKGDRGGVVLRAVHRRKSKKIDFILKAKDKNLFKVKHIKVSLPEEAKIYSSIRCETCKEKTMEPRLRVKGGKVVCISCFEGNRGVNGKGSTKSD